MPPIGGKADPFYGFGEILFDASAGNIAGAQKKLRAAVSPFGGFTKPFRRLRSVSVGADIRRGGVRVRRC